MSTKSGIKSETVIIQSEDNTGEPVTIVAKAVKTKPITVAKATSTKFKRKKSTRVASVEV